VRELGSSRSSSEGRPFKQRIRRRSWSRRFRSWRRSCAQRSRRGAAEAAFQYVHRRARSRRCWSRNASCQSSRRRLLGDRSCSPASDGAILRRPRSRHAAATTHFIPGGNGHGYPAARPVGDAPSGRAMIAASSHRRQTPPANVGQVVNVNKGLKDAFDPGVEPPLQIADRHAMLIELTGLFRSVGPPSGASKQRCRRGFEDFTGTPIEACPAR